jgi:hypothetical protein
MAVGVSGDADDVGEVVSESRAPVCWGCSPGALVLMGAAVWVLAATLGVGQMMG